MNRVVDILARLLDVDASQWRALVRTTWKILFRSPGAFTNLNSARQKGGMFLGVFLYGILGIFIALMAWEAPTAGIGAFIGMVIVMVYLASLVLLEFGSTIVAPEDVLILGFRPITSRTYFVARLTGVLLLLGIYAAALGLIPTVLFVVRFGPLAGIGWLLALGLEALAVGIFMIILYGVVLRFTKPGRLRMVLGFVQMGLSFFVYGGFVGLSKHLPALFAFTEEAGAWLFLFPPRWFAALVDLAVGSWSPLTALGGVLSVACVVAVARGVSGRIALDYIDATTAAATASTDEPRPAVRRRGRSLVAFLRRPEDRAVARLVIKQFRFDTKFKMTVLSIIPLTAFYLYQGLQNSRHIVDPFLGRPSSDSLFAPALLYLAAMLFPVILKEEISRSDSYQASWVFFSSPVERGTLVLAVRRVLTTLFITPYMVLLGGIFLFFFGNIFHTLLHMLVLAAGVDLIFQGQFLLLPRMPFSSPRTTGERTASMFAAMLLGPGLLIGLLSIFTLLLAPSVPLYLTGLAVLLVLAALMRWLVAARVKYSAEKLEFVG